MHGDLRETDSPVRFLFGCLPVVAPIPVTYHPGAHFSAQRCNGTGFSRVKLRSQSVNIYHRGATSSSQSGCCARPGNINWIYPKRFLAVNSRQIR